MPPEWRLAFWKEIDDKTFGKGSDCFTEDATCNLGIADWHGREQIRENPRAFIAPPAFFGGAALDVAADVRQRLSAMSGSR